MLRLLGSLAVLVGAVGGSDAAPERTAHQLQALPPPGWEGTDMFYFKSGNWTAAYAVAEGVALYEWEGSATGDVDLALGIPTIGWLVWDANATTPLLDGGCWFDRNTFNVVAGGNFTIELGDGAQEEGAAAAADRRHGDAGRGRRTTTTRLDLGDAFYARAGLPYMLTPLAPGGWLVVVGSWRLACGGAPPRPSAEIARTTYANDTTRRFYLARDADWFDDADVGVANDNPGATDALWARQDLSDPTVFRVRWQPDQLLDAHYHAEVRAEIARVRAPLSYSTLLLIARVRTE